MCSVKFVLTRACLFPPPHACLNLKCLERHEVLSNPAVGAKFSGRVGFPSRQVRTGSTLGRLGGKPAHGTVAAIMCDTVQCLPSNVSERFERPRRDHATCYGGCFVMEVFLGIGPSSSAGVTVFSDKKKCSASSFIRCKAPSSVMLRAFSLSSQCPCCSLEWGRLECTEL